MSDALSVVMPVHDEAQRLPATIDALVAAVEPSGFVAELVLVDDGSSDGSADSSAQLDSPRPQKSSSSSKFFSLPDAK